ncbi:hypothetical protein BH20GEM3_BH20GEM3_12320 [soil metagenome]
MRKTLLGAMAATLLVTSGVQAQDEMMMSPSPSRFTLGVYGGLAYSTSWAQLGTVPAFAGAPGAPARPAQGGEDVSPGLAPMFGGIGMFTLRGIGLRLHYGYMPSHIYGTSDNFRFPDSYPLNNHFYDLSLLFRPFSGRMGGFLGSAYGFIGGGGLTSDFAGDTPSPIPSFAQRGVILDREPSGSTVGQVTAGIGGDIFALFGLGFFLEAAVHGYDSPMHVRGTAPGQFAGSTGAEDKFAFTPNVKLGVAFGFGAPRAPVIPPPPPPPPPMDLPPPVEAPAEQAIRVCILEGGQLREVDAMVNPATGDTMAVMAGERRRFADAYPATTGYAGGADFFVQDRPVTFRNRRYVRFGLTRIIPATDVRAIGDFQGATLFAETGANMQNPDVLYVLVRPGCEFQPYQREAAIRPRG